VLKSFVAVRQEIEMFFNGKCKVFVEVTDEIWLWELVCDIRERLSFLNTKLQGQAVLFFSLRAL
jgi:hypothetical protein